MTILFLAAALLAPASATPQTFTDWTVACDTIRRCEAQALLPENGEAGWALLGVVRTAGPAGAATISVLLRDRAAPAAMRIDGRAVRLATAGDGRAHVPAAQVAAVLPRLAAARRIVLLDGGGGTVARISPAGASAALRFIDAAQGRAGGVTAIVARGPRPASAVPPAPAMPTFAAVTPPRTPPAIVAPARIARMRRTSGCPVEDGFPASAERHRIATGLTLVLLSCGAGAYNAFSVPWLVADGGRRPPGHAPFEVLPADDPDRPDRPMLVNARFDPRTGTLSSFAKARGIGDCGTSADYRWDGARFRTVEQRVMGACRGSTDYLRIRVARAR